MEVYPRRPGVLQVITRMNVGGPARAVAALQDLLAERGWAPTLAHGAIGDGEGELPADGDVVRVPTLARPLHPARDLAASRRLGELIERLRPDVVHTHMAKAGGLGRIAAVRGHVPVVVHTFHGHVLQEYFGRLTNAAFAAAERRLARRTDALVAVAPQVRDDLLGLGIGTPDRWHVIPVGVDADALRPEAPAVARARLGLPPDGPVIGCVGRLVPIKDHDTFLRAAARIARGRPDAVFVIAGDGPSRDPLARRAQDLGLAISFLGWVEDLPALYGALDVAVLTSRLEGTPLALMEAGAAGLPTVATRVGGVPDVVAGGETGMLVPPGDDAAVGEAVVRLLDDRHRARAMGERAAERIRTRFSLSGMADGLDAIYRGLLEGEGRAGTGDRRNQRRPAIHSAATTAPTASTTGVVAP